MDKHQLTGAAMICKCCDKPLSYDTAHYIGKRGPYCYRCMEEVEAVMAGDRPNYAVEDEADNGH